MTNTAYRFSILAFVAVMFIGLNAEAGTEKEAGSDVEIRITTGVKSMFGIGWTFIPLPATGVLSVDFAKYFRARLEFTHHLAQNVTRPSVGVGAVIPVVGANAYNDGGFQLKIPLMFDFGFAYGSVDAGDSYTENVRALLFGPGTGLDFTWWNKNHIGFVASLAGSYMFRENLPSAHNLDMSWSEDTSRVWEAAILLGVAF